MKAYLVKKEIPYTSGDKSIFYKLYIPKNQTYILFSCSYYEFINGSHKFELFYTGKIRRPNPKADEIEMPDETVEKLRELFDQKWKRKARGDLENELEKLLT